MITGINQPKEDSIRLDSDNIRIDATTDNDDTLLSFHITSGIPSLFNMPKYNDFKAVINLKGLIRNRKPTQHLVLFSPSLYKVENIFTINSYITEHLDKTSIDNMILGSFKIMYSSLSIEKLRDAKFYFLGIPDSLVISNKTTLSIPFFTKSNSLFYRIQDQNGNVINSGVTPNIEGYYLFQNVLDLDYDVESLIVSLRDDTTEIHKKIRVLKNTLHSPINVRFINQFGALIYAQLFGELSENPAYKNSIYTNHNGLLYNAEVEVESQITLNTGYLFKDEKFLVEQILTSLNVEVEYQGKYVSVVPSTKSIKNYVSNQWVYSNLLTFKFNKYEAN